MLAVVLACLSILFAGVVYLTKLDAERVLDNAQTSIDRQNRARLERLDGWYDEVRRQHARQLAAPFLWNVATLEGVAEGTPEFEKLQRRMWQFVYGRENRPLLEDAPVGPLESVVIVGLDHRIVAASDPMVVDKRFTDPQEIARLEAALVEPQLETLATERGDGRAVQQVTVAVPGAKGTPIGIVRMRYVGSELAQIPGLPPVRVDAQTRLWGPMLAGVLALLGVGFGAYATFQVISLTRRLEAMAEGQRLPPQSGPGGVALSMIEKKLESLSTNLRRDDLLVSSLTEALREGLVLVDTDRRTLVANSLAQEVLRLDLADEATRVANFEELLRANPELDAVVDAGLARGEAVRELSLLVRHVDGEHARIQVTSYVLQDGGRATGLMLLLKDENSIATLERNLREASRLQTIVSLTGSVAHEVKNPLGAIGIHLEHLRRRLTRSAEGDPQSVERITVIREEIDRLREILDEWLRLTSPEERAAEPAPVTEVLTSVGRLLRVEARHQSVELVVDTHGEGSRVTLSSARLRQVLLNLAINALQVMPRGGRLSLRAEDAGQWVMLEVEDTGPGIPKELRERIFDVHFTTREGGSGLGLPICRRIVEEAGGHLTFITTPGQGTIFRVVLPVSHQAQRAADPVLRAGAEG